MIAKMKRIKSQNSSSKSRLDKADSVPRGTNELLKKALEDATNPGIGDEEPEVLEDSNVQHNRASEMKRGSGFSNKDSQPDAKQRRSERNKAIEEEERKQAEMTFDIDALLPSQSMLERTKYIPLRLTYEERKTLRLVNASINVSDYTTVVDIVFKNKARWNYFAAATNSCVPNRHHRCHQL